jgi:hypothetical protein
LKEIVQLQYNADSSGHRSVVLFQCDWFDTGSNRARMKGDGFLEASTMLVFGTRMILLFYLHRRQRYFN